MKKIYFLILAILVITAFGSQTAPAQFPKIKLPKITEPKTQPTPADTTQPTTNNNGQPVQTQNQTASSQAGPSISKPSIQFFLQVHKGYKGDPETWSWTPMINFRVNGPFKPGDQVSVEYTLPGKTWKYDCNPKDAGPSSAWVGVICTSFSRGAGSPRASLTSSIRSTPSCTR